MSSNIIDFREYQRLGEKRSSQPTWVPEFAYELVEGRGIPYWTGKETLCRLIKNHSFRGDPKSYPYENPYKYESIGASWDPIQRDAPPPDCPVNQFDWDDFERKAFEA